MGNGLFVVFRMPTGTDIFGYSKVLETLIIVILARLLRFGIDQIFIKIVKYHNFCPKWDSQFIKRLKSGRKTTLYGVPMAGSFHH